MHLVRSVGDAERPRPPVHPLQGQVAGNAGRAPHLDRPVDHSFEGCGHEHLDGRDVRPHVADPGVDDLGRVNRHQPRRHDVDVRIGDETLDKLLLFELAAVDYALGGPADHEVEGAPHLADAVHAVEDASGSQPLLGCFVAASFAPERVRHRDAHVLEDDLAVVPIGVPPHGHAADDAEARRVRGHDDLGHAVLRLAGPVVFGGAAHHDGEVRPAGVRTEPLVAVNHPLVPFADGSRLDGVGVRAGRVGLGHSEAGLDLPADEGFEPLLFLLLRPVPEEDGLVPGVGGHDTEEPRSEWAPRQDFVHVGVLHEADAHPAVLLRQVGGP